MDPLFSALQSKSLPLSDAALKAIQQVKLAIQGATRTLLIHINPSVYLPMLLVLQLEQSYLKMGDQWLSCQNVCLLPSGGGHRLSWRAAILSAVSTLSN